VYGCEPTLSEVSATLDSYLSPDFQEAYESLENSMCPECLHTQLKIFNVDVAQNKSYDTKVLYWIETIPNVALTQSLLDAQCPMLIALTQLLAPLKTKRVNCEQTLVFNWQILTQIVIYEYPESEELYSATTSTSTILNYNYQVLLLLVLWSVLIASSQ